MKENAPVRFNVGDKVIAKHDIGESGVLEGDILPVLKTHDCPNCGNQSIDVGVREPAAISFTCTLCRHQEWRLDEETEDKDVWFLNSYNFDLYNESTAFKAERSVDAEDFLTVQN